MNPLHMEEWDYYIYLKTICILMFPSKICHKSTFSRTIVFDKSFAQTNISINNNNKPIEMKCEMGVNVKP